LNENVKTLSPLLLNHHLLSYHYQSSIKPIRLKCFILMFQIRSYTKMQLKLDSLHWRVGLSLNPEHLKGTISSTVKSWL